MGVRQPRLLDKGLQEVARLRPSALSAINNLSPISTATMEIPEGEPTVNLRDFVEVYGPDGSLGVFRVASARTSYRNSQQLSLEHALCTLADDLTPGSTRNEDNDVVDFKIEGTIPKIVSTILSYQTEQRWQVGTIQNTGKGFSLVVDRETLLDAVISANELQEGYGIFPDTTTYPWTLNIKKLETTPSSECRMTRNAPGVTIAYEDSDLVTRVYHPALSGGYLDADTISTWGVISQEIPVQDDAVPEEVLEYAQKFLADRKNPRVNVEVDGLYLAQITGEPLDAFKPGQLCRVALPDYGVAVNERIVSVHFPDLVGMPEQVTISLSTSPRTLSRDLASIKRETESTSRTSRSYGSSIRAINNDLKEKNTLIAELENEIILRATVEQLEATNKRVSQAEISIDGLEAEIVLKASVETVDALSTRVTQAEIDINGDDATIGLKTRVEQNSSFLTDLDKRVSTAEINIDGANAQIALKASQAQVDEQGAKISSAEVRLDGIDAEIDLKVSKNGVISAINLSPEEVKISSNKITLNGETVAKSLSGRIVSVANIEADQGDISEIYSGRIEGSSAYLDYLYLQLDQVSWQSKSVVTGYTTSGSQQFVTVNDTSGNPINVLKYGTFNKSTIYYIGRE